MRKILLVAVASALVVAVAPTARASHHPDSHCSESGDVCQSTTKVEGIRKLRVTLAAKYFDRYKLCVIAPDGHRACKSFEIHKQGSVYGDSVGWRKHFTDEGNGAYTVIWKTGGERFGEKLGFHR